MVWTLCIGVFYRALKPPFSLPFHHRFRLYQLCSQFVRRDLDGDGDGDFFIPGWDEPGRAFEYAIPRFEREGARVPLYDSMGSVTLEASCAGSGKYCEGDLMDYDPDVCPEGYNQIGYDRCCRNGLSDCKYAHEDL